MINIFATSKLWYKASTLPLPPKYAKKCESLLGSFLWVGKLERLQLVEVKNSLSAGGLGLPCVSSKANSLFLKQTCRLILDVESKQSGHVKHWLGLHLKHYFPVMAEGPHAEIVCPYFQHMRLLLVEGLVLGEIQIDRIRSVTAKKLYEDYTSTFPPPKVIYRFDVDWALVWGRLENLSLDSFARECLFSIIHNIVPNRERLHSKMNLVHRANCLICVREAWGWLRLRLLDFLPKDCASTSNFEFMNLMFAKYLFDREAVWLIGTFVELVWVEKLQKREK